jgi:hypothetical protein
MNVHNYYVMTSERGTNVMYARVGRGPVGSWQITEYWNRDKHRWERVDPEDRMGGSNLGTRYRKEKNARLAMLAVVREATMSPLEKIIRADRKRRTSLLRGMPE